jgi:hypothetical protein
VTRNTISIRYFVTTFGYIFFYISDHKHHITREDRPLRVPCNVSHFKWLKSHHKIEMICNLIRTNQTNDSVRSSDQGVILQAGQSVCQPSLIDFWTLMPSDTIANCLLQSETHERTV